MEKIIYTGDIPQCPYCEKPTKRTSGMSTTTSMYYPPAYDENGINTNPDRNIITQSYECLNCNKEYQISGNDTDGFEYDLKE